MLSPELYQTLEEIADEYRVVKRKGNEHLQKAIWILLIGVAALAVHPAVAVPFIGAFIHQANQYHLHRERKTQLFQYFHIKE